MMRTWCSKHVEVRNKLIVKQKCCASSWLITKINILRCTVSKTSKFCDFVTGEELPGWSLLQLGLKRGSAVASLLGLWFRIPSGHGCLLRLLCTLRYRSLRQADHSSREVLPSVVCLSVISKQQGGDQGPLLLSSHERKKRDLLSANSSSMFGYLFRSSSSPSGFVHFRNKWVSFSSCPQRRHIYHLVLSVFSVPKFPTEPCYTAYIHCAAWCTHLSSQGIFQFTVYRWRPLFSHSSLPPLSLDAVASNFNK